MFIQTQIYKENEAIKVTHDKDLEAIELTINNTLFISLSKAESLKLAADISAEAVKL